MHVHSAATFTTDVAVVAPDPLARLDALRRAPLLVQAARFGLGEYRRPLALRRLLGRVPPPGAGVLGTLLDLEARHEAGRVACSATWRAGEHVEVLIAVMAEGQLLAALRGAG